MTSQLHLKYIERKIDGLDGQGRIARLLSSRTGRTLFFEGRVLEAIGGMALKANFRDTASGEEFWISNPRRDGMDSLYPGLITIDPEVSEEYWTQIRNEPEKAKTLSYRSPGRKPVDRDRLQKAVRRHDMDRRYRAPRSSA